MSKKTNTQATTETTSVKRGRPTIAGSARQERLARWESLKAQGYNVRAGRPKGGVKKVVADTAVESK